MGVTRMDGSIDSLSRTADPSRREPPFGAPYAFVLVVIEGDDAAAAHRIVRTETIIGRGGESHFSIEDDQMSRVHCRIRVEGPVCTIADAASRNGTSVNGRRLLPNVAQRLRNLDEIAVGSHRLMLLCGKFPSQRKKADR